MAVAEATVHRITLGTKSGFKEEAVRGQLPEIGTLAMAYAGLPVPRVELSRPSESFSPSEDGLHEFANAQQKAEAAAAEGGEGFGWDIGLQIRALNGPGPHIKRIVGEDPTNEEVYQYYREKLTALPENERRGQLNYALCYVDGNGTKFFTSRRIDVHFDVNAKAPEGKTSPLDTMMVIDKYNKPYSELSPEEKKDFDRGVAEGMLTMVAEADAMANGIDTRMSYRDGDRVWVFSPEADPRMQMRLYSEKDGPGVNKMSEALMRYYDGHEKGWVNNQYAVGKNQTDGDTNGHHTKRRNLIVMGEIGDPVAQLSLVVKRGGSSKINTWVVRQDLQGNGVGRKMLTQVDDMSKALGIRKLYATTGSPPALKSFLGAGYRLEAELPGQYKPGIVEAVVGKMLISPSPEDRPSTDTSMIVKGGDFSRLRQVREETDRNAVKALLGEVSGWQDEMGPEVIDNLFRGAERGLTDIAGKGKLMLVSENTEGQQQGVLVATLKRGGAMKVYPVIAPAEDQSALFSAAETEGMAAGARLMYTFCPVWDEKEIEVLSNQGFIRRGVLRSPYKPGADLIQWSKSIGNNTL